MMLFGTEPVFKNATIAILGRISRLWLRPRVEREHRQGASGPVAHPPTGRTRALRDVVRRQPAESRAGEMADLSAAGADP